MTPQTQKLDHQQRNSIPVWQKDPVTWPLREFPLLARRRGLGRGGRAWYVGISVLCFAFFFSAQADTVPPTITCPPNTTVECPGDTSPASTGNPTTTPGDPCTTVT